MYVNRLKGNTSKPSSENASYHLLIKAPKEPRHLGVYDQNKTYEYNDMVMWDNSTWIKTNSPEQEIPSAGWKLVAKAVRGRKGEKGDVSKVEFDGEAVITELQDEIMLLKEAVKGLTNAHTN